jgi:hypothetical protein
VAHITALIITEIRKSKSLSDFDLLTAVFLNSEGCDDSCIQSSFKKSCNGLVILESATAEQDLPDIGVKCGDRFLRMWAKPYHGLMVGDEMWFEGPE